MGHMPLGFTEEAPSLSSEFLLFFFTEAATSHLGQIYIHRIQVSLQSPSHHCLPAWCVEVILSWCPLHPHDSLHFDPDHMLRSSSICPVIKGDWPRYSLVNDCLCECGVKPLLEQQDCPLQVSLPSCCFS